MKYFFENNNNENNNNYINVDNIPLDSGFYDDYDDDAKPELYNKEIPFSEFLYFGNCINTVPKVWDATQMAHFLLTCKIIKTDDVISNLEDGDRNIPKKFLSYIKKLRKNNEINDTSKIVSAINDYQKILVIYIADFDTHFFFDCR